MSNDITTGISAPPIGITTNTPKTRERITAKTKIAYMPAGFIEYMTQNTITALIGPISAAFGDLEIADRAVLMVPHIFDQVVLLWVVMSTMIRFPTTMTVFKLFAHKCRVWNKYCLSKFLVNCFFPRPSVIAVFAVNGGVSRSVFFILGYNVVANRRAKGGEAD